MQRCEKCKNKFKYGEILNSVWKGYKPIKCSHCKTNHSPITLTIIITSLLLIMPAFFTKGINNYFSSTFNSIIFYIFWVVFSVGISPMIMRYTMTKKSK